jgi:hypothetical protein
MKRRDLITLLGISGRHIKWNHNGLGVTTRGLEKDAAERISSTPGKYEPGKKEPRVGGREAPGVKRGLGGTSGPFCAAF